MRINGLINNLFKENSLIKNLSYLTILQIFNLILPIITFPYLIRVLGKEIYGLIIFAQAIIAYFSIFINFGFNISATKDISLNRNNIEKLSEIVNSVLVIKSSLFILSMIILSIGILFIPFIRDIGILLILTMGLSLYEAIFPIWYFQGIEKMKYITFINLITRGSFTILIFILIKDSSDYLIVPTLNTLGAFFAGIISMYLLYYKHKLSFSLPPTLIIINYIKESLHFFLSRATGILIARTNTVLIGAFMGYTEVAYYDLALKISELSKIPSNLINQTIYPRISITKNMIIVSKIMKYNFLLSIFIFALLIIFINHIVILLGGSEMLPAKNLILLLNTTAPLAGLSYFMGNTMLVVNGYYKEFNMSIIYEAFIYITLITLLILFNFHNLYTFIIIIIICTTFEVLYRYYFIKKFKIVY